MLVIGNGPASTTRLGTLVPAHGYREILFLPMRNLVLEKYKGEAPDASTPGIAAKLGFDEVMPLAALPGVVASFVSGGSEAGADAVGAAGCGWGHGRDAFRGGRNRARWASGYAGCEEPRQ